MVGLIGGKIEILLLILDLFNSAHNVVGKEGKFHLFVLFTIR
jgi:hypothetical protein